MGMFSSPRIGLGTWPMRGAQCRDAVLGAIDIGYRLIDTAMIYDNEAAVGQGIQDSGVGRERIFVQSKLPGRFHDRDRVLPSVQETLWRLRIDTLDAYLIHWPNPGNDKYVEAWKGILDARDAGLVKHVGVCNFYPEMMDRLHAETGEYPEVDQVELNPYKPQHALRDYCRERGISVEGWSPIGRGNELLAEPVLGEIAELRGAEPSQVVLAWHLACGVTPLPKSADAAHQGANLRAEEIVLTEEDVLQITRLARTDAWDEPMTFVQN